MMSVKNCKFRRGIRRRLKIHIYVMIMIPAVDSYSVTH